MSIEWLVAGLVLVAALVGLAVWHGRRAVRTLKAVEADLHRAEVAGQDQAERLAALEKLRDGQQRAEQVIATGTAVVREVHKGIAEIPLAVLEAIPGAKAPAQALRGLHHSISDGVYGALENLNKAVGRELRRNLPAGSPPSGSDFPPAPASAPGTPLHDEIPDDEPDHPSGQPKLWG
jgi:hypothetical protein